MSEYDYEDRRGHDRTRFREPEYVSETTYIQRGHGRPPQDLVVRGRDDSTEEIPRDFPPAAEYRRSHVRDNYAPPARAHRASRYEDRYDDDYYSDYGPAPARGPRRGDRRDDYADDYYSDDHGRPKRDRRKSKIESTLESLGLGGAVGALLGSGSASNERHERGGYEEDRSAESRKKWQQAAKAAVISGVVEAVRSRNEPGGWTGPKGQRVATAALGAAGIDGLVNMGKNPRKNSKRHVLESVVGGLAANRIANGPRDRSGSRGRSRSRSRSVGGLRARSRSLFRSLSRGRQGSRSDSYSPSPSRARSKGRGLKELAAAGGIAAAGKAIYDRVRSKSRGRTRDASASSADSYVPGRRQRYGTDRGHPADMEDGLRGRDREAGEGAPRGGELVARGKRDSSPDSISTTDMEAQRKKMRGKELLTAGLATVATIHAAHGVYSSMVASEKRHKLVMDGEMSPDEARKRKSKNVLQDVAAVGIAALGIKSAFSEWKEMSEHRHEAQGLEEKRRKRQKQREKRHRERLHAGYGGQNDAYNQSVPYGYNDNYRLPPPPMGAQSYR